MDDQELAWQELHDSGVAQVLSEAARVVYPRVANEHDPERGHDGNTFGVLVWREMEYEVRQRVRHLTDVRDERPQGSFCLRLPSGRRVYFKKYGPAENFQIDRLRWDSELRASLATANARSMQQLAFDLRDGALTVEDDRPLTEPRLDLVAAHTGDPELGGYELSIGAPQLIEDEPNPWVWVRQLLSEPGLADEERQSPPENATGPNFSDLQSDEPELEDVEPEDEDQAGESE